jgi:hypothetical protein
VGQRGLRPNELLTQARLATPSASGSGQPMSRQELAEAASRYLDKPIDAKYIGRLERGDYRWPNSHHRQAIRRVLRSSSDAELGFYVSRSQRRDVLTSDSRDEAIPSLPGPTSVAWHRCDAVDTVDDVKRRAALTLPALSMVAAVLPAQPWSRLAHALVKPDQLDEQTVEGLESDTAELFRREENLSSRRLTAELNRHIERMKGLLTCPPDAFKRRLLTTTGEALALAGWLAWDRHDSPTANTLYRDATQIAQKAGDGPLLGCVLGYRSYQAEAEGDLLQARRFLVEAQTYVRGEGNATTRAWLAAREAEVNASLSDGLAALRALDRAMTAYDYAHPYRERPWTGFFTPSRLGSMAITTYARLNHPDLDATTNSMMAALPSTDKKIKAVILADVATAAIQRGRYDRGASLGHEALDQTLAQEASLGAQRLRHLHSVLLGKRGVPVLEELDDRLLAHVA